MLTDKEFLSFINDKSLNGSLEENLNRIIDEEMEKSEEEMDTELIEYCLDKLSKLEAEAPDTEEKKGNGDSNGKHMIKLMNTSFSVQNLPRNLLIMALMKCFYLRLFSQNIMKFKKWSMMLLKLL